MGGLGP